MINQEQEPAQVQAQPVEYQVIKEAQPADIEDKLI